MGVHKGTGYASPAVAGDRVLFVHRVGDEEVVVCLGAETGVRHWEFRYPTDFEDRYGYNNGPRSSPIVDGDRVYTMGAQARLHCLALETGKLIWRRNIAAEYKVPQDFFGTASTPLVDGGRLIVNVGAPGGPCVAALDALSGRELWVMGRSGGPATPRRFPQPSTTAHGCSSLRAENRRRHRWGLCSDPPTAA